MDGNGVFTIDGLNFRLFVTEIKRSFAVTDSDNSGRTQSYRMHRDIIGTFYNYTLTVEPDSNFPNDYDQFYQIISSPVESHKMVFPFNQEIIEFEAYVNSGDDTVKINSNQVDGRKNKWSGLSISFTAMEPQRR